MAGGGRYTVIPHVARGFISCRLVGDQDPQRVLAAVRGHVAPVSARAACASPSSRTGERCPPIASTRRHPAIAAATEALRAVYPDQQVLQAVIAGTLPATTLFEQVLGAKTLFFSFSTADEKLHAPNEFLRLRRIHEGMRAWDALLTVDGRRPPPPSAGAAAPSCARPRHDQPTTPPSATSTHEPAAFARFPLAPESGRVPAYDGGFDAGHRRARRSAAQRRTSWSACTITRSGSRPTWRLTPQYNRTGRQHTAFAGLAASGLTAVFDNMMDGTAYVTGNTPWQWDDVVTDLGMRQADIAHQDRVDRRARPCETSSSRT